MGIINAASQGYWRKTRPEIPAATTIDILTIPLDSFSSFKVYLEFSNTTENKFKSLEMRAFKVGASDVSDTIYSVISNSVNVLVNLNVVGSDAVLSVTNNESFSLSTNVSYLI
jgi:hypothetical protein